MTSIIEKDKKQSSTTLHDTEHMVIQPSRGVVWRAYNATIGIGAFNVNNLEWAHAIIDGAASVKRGRPHDVILQVTMGAAKYMGGYKLAHDMIVDLIEYEKQNGEVPQGWFPVLHADHADYDSCLEAIDAGFTSVMFDGSALPIEENVARSREIIFEAHSRGVSVEVEVGTIGGSEDGVYGSGETSPIEDVLRMATLRPDMMAVGIGNIHGPYPKDWGGLHFEYLSKLRDALGMNGLDMPLVLHGGSGIPDDQIIKAIVNGVTKINVNTELQLVFYHEIIKQANRLTGIGEDGVIAGKLYDPRSLLKSPTKAMADKVEAMIRFFDLERRTSDVHPS
jgi:fructose-bisphosphate aldolase class II